MFISNHNINSERAFFWEIFQEELNLNGNPFRIATRNQYGTINQDSANSNLCLGIDFLIQKGFFRIGIYIQDDKITPHFDWLYSHKDEIEAMLGFAPIWTKHGTKNPNTRRIETQLPFIPYNHDDYERLIEEILPIALKYIEVFSKYLPEAF